MVPVKFTRHNKLDIRNCSNYTTPPAEFVTIFKNVYFIKKLWVILGMENKWVTLQAIYNIIKDDPHPTNSLLPTNDLILRQNFPWDEVVSHLNELQADGLVTLKQLSVAVISITEKGLQFLADITPVV